ncbi:MAG: 50S ribosomal protein L9 [Alphaproteobacteria bacterium]|jgi:large subunit ribosomal protein L9|nr:50S ribosomal protein L9 [Alphaproteobacteria bacterium]MDP6517743.1 50S ribosomal protein L9 [Alphaproteobacteria bacterium]
MEVILLERIDRLGQMGDVVKVKDGYARNFLLPRKKALRANKESLERFEAERVQLEATNLERRKEAEAVADKFEGLSVVMVRQAGDTGQLYGSVTARDIATAVTGAGFTIENRQVVMNRVIKTLGLYAIPVKLHPEVTVEITANVARSEEEAKLQARGIDVTDVDREEAPVGAEAEAPAEVEVGDEQAAETAEAQGDSRSET